jgi:hypothetical protein
MLDLGTEAAKGSRERRPKGPSLSGRHQALAARGVEHELYSPGGAILLEPRDSIDGTTKPGDCLAKRALGAKLETRGDGGVMGVKDDLHVLLDTANDIYVRRASVGRYASVDGAATTRAR